MRGAASLAGTRPSYLPRALPGIPRARARRRLGTNSSPYRSPRSPATKRFQPASNLFPGPAALRSLGAGLSLRRLGCRSIGTLGSKLGSGRDPATVSRGSKRPALDRCRRRLPVDLLTLGEKLGNTL